MPRSMAVDAAAPARRRSRWRRAGCRRFGRPTSVDCTCTAPRGVRAVKRQARQRELEWLGRDVGGAAFTRVRDRPPDDARASDAPLRVVEVDDAGRVRRQQLEQPPLRLRSTTPCRRGSRGDRASGCVKTPAANAHGVDALQRQRVRRHLHHRRRAAVVDHLRGTSAARRALPASCEWPRDPRRRRCRRPCRAGRTCMPAASRIDRSRYAVVVLPLVPVMPTTWSVAARVPVERDRRARPAPAGRRAPTTHGALMPPAAPALRRRRRRRRARRPAARTRVPSSFWPRSATNSERRTGAPRVVRDLGHRGRSRRAARTGGAEQQAAGATSARAAPTRSWCDAVSAGGGGG